MATVFMSLFSESKIFSSYKTLQYQKVLTNVLVKLISETWKGIQCNRKVGGALALQTPLLSISMNVWYVAIYKPA